MKRLKNTKGFTLIEVVIVLIIIAVLMAVAVPSVLKYANETDRLHALDDAYACVSAADYFQLQGFRSGKDPNDTPAADIQKKADVKGKVTIFWYENDKLVQLKYTHPNGIKVTFQNDKYYIDEETDDLTLEKYLSNLKYIEKSNNLTDLKNDNSKNGRTQQLQKLYLSENGNKYPSLTQEEIDLMVKQGKYMGKDPKELVWKPLYATDGTIVLFADQQPTAYNALGPMIYYKQKYYVHKSKWGNITAAAVNEGALIIKDNAPYDPSVNDDWILAI